MAILLITHDLGVVRKMADRVCVMNDGEIVEHNGVAGKDCSRSPQHAYTRKLLGIRAQGQSGRTAAPMPRRSCEAARSRSGSRSRRVSCAAPWTM